MSLIIDVGHEGDLKGLDPGAVGNGIVEANLVLQISLYQYERYKQLGVPVKITRTKSQKLSRAERTALVKKSGMKHCKSNHINAGGGDGAEVIHSIHSIGKWAQMTLDALVAVGQNARRVFSKKLSSNSYHDYYYMHRDTGNVETIIVEYGFLDSKKDDVMQLKRDWQLYAEAAVKAYCKYAGYKYVAPASNKKEEPKLPEELLNETGRKATRSMIKKGVEEKLFTSKHENVDKYSDSELISYGFAYIDRKSNIN